MATAVDDENESDASEAALNSYPFWSPRFWHGMRLRAYFHLLFSNGLRIHPVRWGMALGILVSAVFNSVMCRVQWLLCGQRIADTSIDEPPVFIIGHWRSGTTYLHELLVRDERFGYATTYQCFAPYHFFVTEWIIPRILGLLLPAKRPMDNMAAGMDHPQEDEFAICIMGAPTPYVRTAFPNHETRYLELIDMEDVDEHDLRRFKSALLYFMKALTMKTKKRLVLKSPPHTGRIAMLAEMFPGARFIHITRNPYDIFPSIRRTWQALDIAQGFQVPCNDDYLDGFILDCFERMYRGFEQQRENINPDQIYDLRYEDLVLDPIGQLRTIYQQLELGPFESVQSRIEDFIDSQRQYKTNRYRLAPEIKEQINERWRGYFERYGYPQSD